MFSLLWRRCRMTSATAYIPLYGLRYAVRLYCCPSYLCLYYGGALTALLCFFMTDASALSAALLRADRRCPFPFWLSLPRRHVFCVVPARIIVKARTHDRLFCVYSHRPPYGRMAVCGRARLSPLYSCARRQIRICRRAGFIVVSFALSDGRSRPARPNDIRDPGKMSCTACAALLALCVAERERRCLRIDFITLRRICQSGTFPVDVSTR